MACLHIYNRFNVRWDCHTDDLTYSHKPTSPITQTDYESQINVAESYYHKMHQMLQTFETQTHTMEKRIEDIQTHFANWEQFANTTVQQTCSNIQTMEDDILHTYQEKLNKYYEQLNYDLAATVTEKTKSFTQTLDNIASTLYNNIKDHVNNVYNDTTAKLQQAAKDAMDTISQYKEQPETTAQKGTVQKSTLFLNVDPTLYNPPPPRSNPYATTNTNVALTSTETEHTSSDDEWSRFGPTGTEKFIEDNRPLPPLHTHKLVNHVKVPYLGKELTYTWYHMLWSAVQQYGILLIPVEQFKKNMSICPRKYYGTKIDPQRYKDMADALYQLLALTETIPVEHTGIHNIVHHHAANTDGYSALYDIMERIHPLLNTDAKLSTPMSINCSDIHDYYNQLDSYFLHNSLEGLHFTPCQQVNIFLEGLDLSYAPAISQIRQQIRSTWREDDVTPPQDLSLHNLARTIEQIMQEDNTLPVIRAMTREHPVTKTNPKPTLERPRAYIDVQCNYCKSFGHKGIDCDKLAQYLILTDVTTHLTDKILNETIVLPTHRHDHGKTSTE